ncbi:hypothetical protein KCU87_g321, partial [Aureobasidium melanogenum]
MRIYGNTVFYLLYIITMKAKPAPCVRSGSYVLEKRPGFFNQGSYRSCLRLLCMAQQFDSIQGVALLHVSLLQEYGAAATAVTTGAYPVVVEVLETSNAKIGEFRETTAVAVIVLRLVVVKVMVDGVANTASEPAESVTVAPAGQTVRWVGRLLGSMAGRVLMTRLKWWQSQVRDLHSRLHFVVCVFVDVEVLVIVVKLATYGHLVASVVAVAALEILAEIV